MNFVVKTQSWKSDLFPIETKLNSTISLGRLTTAGQRRQIFTCVNLIQNQSVRHQKRPDNGECELNHAHVNAVTNKSSFQKNN